MMKNETKYEQRCADITALTDSMSDVHDRINALLSQCSFGAEQADERLLFLMLCQISIHFDEVYMEMYKLNTAWNNPE